MTMFVIFFVQLFHTSLADPLKINGHLIVSTIFNPLARLPNATTNNLGLLEVELVGMLQQGLNFTYEVRVPTDLVSLGSVNKGVGSGSLGQLIRREVDVFTSGAEMTHDKYPYADATAILFSDIFQIMIPYPEIGRRTDAFVAIYSYEVWICMIAFILIVAATVRCFIGIGDEGNIQRDSILVMIVGLIASQGGFFGPKRFSNRLVWAIWCLSLVVLVNVYTGTLTSMLAAPSYRFLANSIEDVSKNEKIMPYVIKGFLADEYVMQTPLSIYKPIRNRIQENQHLRLPLNSDFCRILSDAENGIFLGSSLLQNALIVSDAKKSRRCRFTLAKKKISSRHISFLLQKNSPLTSVFTRQILQLQQSGLMDHLLTKYVPRPDLCIVKDGKATEKLVTLQLNQFSNAWIFLLVGSIVSFITFLVEVFVGFYTRSNDSKADTAIMMGAKGTLSF